MSLKAYEQAKVIIEKLIKINPKQCYILGGRTQAEISRAEEILGVRFPEVYIHFLKDFGDLSISPDDFLGFRSLEDLNSRAAGMVWHTLKERQRGIDTSLVCFSYSGDGWIYALDCSNLDAEGDAPVLAYDSWDTPKSKMPVEAKGFGEFLLERVQWALKRWEKKQG